MNIANVATQAAGDVLIHGSKAVSTGCKSASIAADMLLASSIGALGAITDAIGPERIATGIKAHNEMQALDI